MTQKRAKTPPNPLPCGCAVYGRQDLESARDDGSCLIVPWTDHHVRHCPLHAAANDLLAACKAALEHLPAAGSEPNSIKPQACKAADKVRAAIAKATVS
jgi:hypothetical protein